MFLLKKLFELVKFLILAVSSLECFSEIRIFLFRLYNRYPLRYSPDSFPPLKNHIFLLPMSDFWCSGTVKKCPENGKNRKEIKWLLIALPKIFRIARGFLFLRFKKNSFFKMSSIKFSFRPKWKKSEPLKKKNDTKAGINPDVDPNNYFA